MTAGSGTQAASTTMAFARLLRNLVRDPEPSVGYVAPIVPDEARTFGLEPLIAESKIYAPERPALHARSTPTSSSATPRTARARSSKRASPRPGPWPRFIALSTAYATWGRPMLPIYLFYSMFGFQRTAT